MNHVLVCLFPDVACSMPEDDLMFSEDEELQGLPISQTSPPQVKTPSADGLLSLNRLVSHYPLRYVIQGVDWLLVPSDNGPNLFFRTCKEKEGAQPSPCVLITFPTSLCLCLRHISSVGVC